MSLGDQIIDLLYDNNSITIARHHQDKKDKTRETKKSEHQGKNIDIILGIFPKIIPNNTNICFVL